MQGDSLKVLLREVVTNDPKTLIADKEDIKDEDTMHLIPAGSYKIFWQVL